MLSYIKDSIDKFRKDALSKVLYDSMKYLFGAFFIVLILKLIPIIETFLSIEYSLSIWGISLSMIIVVILSFFLSYYLFQKKYITLKAENQKDELTGLKNYKALKTDLNKIFEANNQEDLPISFILIDIDNFKKFNEEYGYQKADQILAKIGSLLSRDSRITDETYRYYMRGDEFLIIVKKTSLSEAILAAERKRKLISETTLKLNHEMFNLTVSCGVTELIKNDQKSDVLARTHEALLKAKKAPNKNKVEAIA